MPSLIYTEGFTDDMAQVALASKRQEIFRYTDLLSELPELGSRNLPESIVRIYGGSVRRLAAKPFLVIYEYREDEDAAYILGLDHQKAAW